MMTMPYAQASSRKARDETVKILADFGCESVGFMDEFKTHSVLLAFKWRGRAIQLRASATGWAETYLRRWPWTVRRRVDRSTYEKRALEQGIIAVNCILRDWVKGQITAIECGLMPFEHVFLAYTLTPSGKTLGELSNGMKPGQLGLLALPSGSPAIGARSIKWKAPVIESPRLGPHWPWIK